MKILIAIDSFKGTLSSKELGELIGKELAHQNLQTEFIPISDGGEGLLDALSDALQLQRIQTTVSNPLGIPISVEAGYTEQTNTLVVELAKSSGLPLVPEDQRNPLHTTTYGCGEVLLLAKEKQCRNVLLGVGGSATNDGGLGALQALGVFFEGAPSKACGKDLKSVRSIQGYQEHWLRSLNFKIACDVNNVFTGENGAAKIYGPQKCAPHLPSASIIEELEAGMQHLKNIIKQQTSIDLDLVLGAGAAGGIAGSLHALLKGQLIPGIQIIFEAINLENKIKEADLIITGEGRIDQQTKNAKVIAGITQFAKKYQKDVWVICGQNKLTNRESEEMNIQHIFALTEDSPLEVCLNNPHDAVCTTLQRLKKEIFHLSI